jgi:hypothetical protein
MIRNTLTLLAIGLLAIGSSTANASTTAVQTFTTAGSDAGGGLTMGFDFMTPSSITITQLGVFNAGNLIAGQTIYLYDVTTGMLKAQVNAPATGLVSGNFNYSVLGTAFATNTTDTYSVFSVFSNDNYEHGTFTVAPDIKLVGGTSTTQGLYGTGGATMPPATPYALIATDFIYTPTSVPEPASIAMMGLGLVGVVFARRKMVKRSA